MSIGELIDAIWALPWYKVMVIAVVDDVILFLKLVIPIGLLFVGIAFGGAIFHGVKIFFKKRREKKNG